MKKFILEYPILLVLVMLSLVLTIVQFSVHHILEGDGPSLVDNATCVVRDTVVDGKKVALKLDCQGQEAVTRDSETVVDYLKNPGSLTCTVYESGKAKCELRKP